MDLPERGSQPLIDSLRELSLARTMSQLTGIVRTAARRIARADGATVIFREDDYCHYVDEDAIAPLWLGQKLPLNVCVGGWVIENAAALSIPDVFNDPRIPVALFESTFVKSLFITPIQLLEPIGAIGVYWATSQVPTALECRQLAVLANASSVALQNLDSPWASGSKIDEQQRAAKFKQLFSLTHLHELCVPLKAILR